MNYVDMGLKTIVNRPAMQCNEESCTATEEKSWLCTLEPSVTGMWCDLTAQHFNDKCSSLGTPVHETQECLALVLQGQTNEPC